MESRKVVVSTQVYNIIQYDHFIAHLAWRAIFNIRNACIGLRPPVSYQIFCSDF